MQIQTGTESLSPAVRSLIIQTLSVNGLISPESLGYTLTHEHFQLDFHHFYSAPPPQLSGVFTDPEIKLQTVGFYRQYPYSSHYNLKFYDEDTRRAVKEDLEQYKHFGGVSIVENTSHGLKRDLKFMQDVSRSSGVNVIAGTGHYLAMVQDPSSLSMKFEEMCELYRKDLVEGEQGIKCGFIGEVGSVWPIHGG